jgi:hypothetical protein
MSEQTPAPGGIVNDVFTDDATHDTRTTAMNPNPDDYQPPVTAIANSMAGEASFLNETLPINKDPYANPVDTIRRMRQYSPCFTKAFDRGQKVFVLSEQDDTAYMAIAQWINANIDRLGKNHPKIIAAKTTLGIFINARNNGRTKLPD